VIKAFLSRLQRKHTERECVLCGRARADVPQLVAGARGAVCDECLLSAVAMLDSDARTPDRPPLHYATQTLLILLAKLTSRTPLAESGRALAAAAGIAGGDVAVLREIAAAALRLDHPRAVLDVIDTIPAPTRTADDDNDRALALMWLGRAEEALEVLERVADAPLDPNAAVRTQLNLAAAMVEVGLDVERADASIDAADAALARFVESDTAARGWRNALMTSRARAQLLRGDHARAQATMQEVEAALGALDAAQRMVLGDALAAGAGPQLARTQWERALEEAHPESYLADQLRQRLAAPDAESPRHPNR
jgi:tetratricopeptide (TPR) repeat protein